ncbi:MAG: hypothetical protein JWM11_535 [Planctomycetaceae bacterium]|nr:hypothetical protein [Planctomycetaceae bacterium]
MPLNLHELRLVVGEALDVAHRMSKPVVVAESVPDSDMEGQLSGAVRRA